MKLYENLEKSCSEVSIILDTIKLDYIDCTDFLRNTGKRNNPPEPIKDYLDYLTDEYGIYIDYRKKLVELKISIDIFCDKMQSVDDRNYVESEKYICNTNIDVYYIDSILRRIDNSLDLLRRYRVQFEDMRYSILFYKNQKPYI